MNPTPDDYSRIFLLSHMRACTSLAGHILGSHPRVNGYFEMHISYDDASALDKQLEVYQTYETLKPDSRFLFDKLLHNEYQLRADKLGRSGLSILVSLLEPEKTVKSIVELFSLKDSEELYASPVEAANYYISRVEYLANFCSSIRQDYFYYDAELFRHAPERLLARLTGWLVLDSPLTERYQVFSQTGKARMGDSSKQIISGKIDRSKTDYSHIHIPREQLERTLMAYRNCRQTIIKHSADSCVL